MLSSLYIKNLAIIEELQVSFENGLNIITGETGAGKSLIIKAIQLIMGKRFSEELLRSDTNTLVVEGIFIKNNSETVIRRIYKKGGQSKSFINDEPVKQRSLADTTFLLADLHGQHDHQNLLDSSTHLNYLDSFGNYSNNLTQLKLVYDKVCHCEILLDEKISAQQEYEQKKELHDFQLKELNLYPISKEYEDKLSKKHVYFSKAATIKESINNIHRILDNGESSVLKHMGEITNALEKISEYDESIMAMRKQAESSRIDLEELSVDLQSIKSNIDIDETELEEINENISYLEMLKRKYNGSIDSVIRYRDQLIQADKESCNWKKEIKQLLEQLKVLKSKLLECSLYISNERKITADKLETAIKKNLVHLNMPETQFKVHINSNSESITETGMDSCEFFISTNIGEDIRPISQIASGGEISRIMLAIKMALQSKDIVDTLIFDEIDSGISGVTAERVGSTIEKLSESHQILCITHLSQIAGKGNNHYRVSKKTKDNRIAVKIDKLSHAGRISEIATLISGHNITESSKIQAQELLQLNG